VSAVELVTALAREDDPTAALRRRAAARGGRVVFPEGHDERVLAAAIALRELGIARPLLLGDPARLREAIAAEGAEPGALEIADPATDPRASEIAAHLHRRRGAKGLSAEAASVAARDPLHFGAGLVALGVVDAMVAGAVNATGDVIRAALWNVGLAPGIDVVSGSFLMMPPIGHPFARALLFADAAVVPEPTEEQLVGIGLASVRTWKGLMGTDPLVACLSFSTHGSADHPAAQKMARVAERLRARGVHADGELQLDAAIVADVGARKAPQSTVAGRADILLFPDLEAGNIGYKLTERLGGFHAVGPLVQGLARPVFDLSRGCSAQAIVDTAAIALLTAGGGGGQG
jgi:phosphate acetyltransferase